LRSCRRPPSSPAPTPNAPEALPEGGRGVAAKYAGDVGIERDPAVLFHDDFETGDPRRRWDEVYHDATARLTDDPARVHAGQRALEFVVPKQQAEHSNAAVKHLKEGQTTVFLRYYSRFDEGFDQVGSSHNGGYLAAIAPGLPYATSGVRADGRNKFAASFENWRGDEKTPSPGPSKVYCYHPAQRSDFGDHFFPPAPSCPSPTSPATSAPTSSPAPTSPRASADGTASS
jgi:hypothetical protein